MVQPESKTKIKLVREAIVPIRDKDGKLSYDAPVSREGSEHEVDQEVAKELCDTAFDCPPQYRGERDAMSPDSKQGTKIYRAVRL